MKLKLFAIVAALVAAAHPGAAGVENENAVATGFGQWGASPGMLVCPSA